MIWQSRISRRQGRILVPSLETIARTISIWSMEHGRLVARSILATERSIGLRAGWVKWS